VLCLCSSPANDKQECREAHVLSSHRALAVWARTAIVAAIFAAVVLPMMGIR